ncbi:MAG: DUF2023 family protein [Prevotella sp.]|jgi:hypothetical protein|uniref:DUF2023 family protein n=1 Tax=Prevotella sp. TaxID=59823 RepID=UPI004026B9F4|nr:DUF2023 family protein [Prevotella sp.]
MNYPSSATQQDTTRLPEDMKVLVNHIYEFKKGVRRMVLFTFNKRYEQFAVTRLQHQNISYIIQPVGNDRLNLFFGKKECLDAIRLMITKPLCQLTPEEDFILGAMLGYDICAQCERYCERKSRQTECSTCNAETCVMLN